MSTKQTKQNTPTEDEILDYHEGTLEPERAREVTEFLTAHPERALELKNWTEIEHAFQGFAAKSPSAAVLQRVRHVAHTEVSGKTNILSWLSRTFSQRKLALAGSFFVIVGIGVATKRFVTENADFNPSTIKASVVTANQDSAVMPIPQNGNTSPELLLWADAEFDRALSLFSEGSYDSCQEILADIAAKVPDFNRRKELYSFWIESLKKMGQFEMAEQKQMDFEKIPSP